MYVKFPLGDLNLSPYPSYPTSIYTCGVTTAPRVHGGNCTTNNTFLYPIKNNKLILIKYK